MQELEEFALDPEELKEAAKQDLNVFGMVAAPEDVTLEFPPLFIQLWFMLINAVSAARDFSKFCVGLPRGHGKTFFIKLFILFCILFTKKRFILVIGSTAQLAQNIIADVVDMLDSNNITELFGNWRFSLEIDRQDYKKFVFNGRPVILKAAGAGTSIRGITVKNSRPDLMIFDDAQTADCAASVNEATKFNTWFTGTALKAKSGTGCTFIYIGNMYRDIEIKKGLYTCMLRNLQLNSAWTSFIVGGILADGKALWEELQPLEQLLEELEQDIQLDQEEVFYAEVLNDPAAISKRTLNIAKLKPFSKIPGDQHFGSFVMIDPSSGKKNPKLDDLALGYFEIFDGTPVLMELRTGKMSPLQCIHETLRICVKHGCGTVFAEDYAYQSTLLFWFEHVMEQMGFTGVALQPINSHGRSKNARIVEMFRSWENQEIRAAETVHSICVAQAAKFNPLIKDNIDDILDLMSYALQIFAEYRNLLVLPYDSSEDEPSVDELVARTNQDLWLQHAEAEDYTTVW